MKIIWRNKRELAGMLVKATLWLAILCSPLLLDWQLNHAEDTVSTDIVQLPLSEAPPEDQIHVTQPTIVTDNDDYPPGSTAYFIGAGFQPGEVVDLIVTRADWNEQQNAEFHNGYAIADANGEFVAEWYVCPELCRDATLILVAIGQSSDLTATTTFKDGDAQHAAWTQAAGGSWTSSTLNSSALYQEGDTVPSRIDLAGLDPNTSYTVTIRNDSFNGTIHFIDGLRTYNRTVNSATLEASLPTSTPQDVAIPADTSDPEPPAGQVLKLYGATTIGNPWGAYTTAGAERQITFTFTTTSGGTAGSKTVNLVYGAHIAREDQYGTGQGARNWPGASGKMGMGFAGKTVDTGLSPGGLIQSADLSVTLSATPNPVCQGATLTYSVAVANAGPNAGTSISVVVTKPDGSKTTLNFGTVAFDTTSPAQTVTYSVPTSASGTLSASATVSASTADTVPGNDSASTTTSVNAKTVISGQPAAQDKAIGDSATFSVTATGATGYQWYKGASGVTTSPLNGQNGASLTINPIASSDEGSYWVRVSGACGNVDSAAAILTVSKFASHIVINPSPANYTYNGLPQGVTASVLDSSNNPIAGATATISYSVTGGTTYGPSATAPSNAGTYSVSASWAGDADYGPSSANGNLTIARVTVTGSFTADNKTYDRNTAAVVLTRNLSGVLAGDAANVNLGGTATFANANAGLGKTVTMNGASLTGSAAGNYNLTSVSTTTADIYPLAITGSFTAMNKTYDGNTAATVVGPNLSGVLGGDSVTLTGTASFANANVGTGKTVTMASPALTGAAAASYSLTSVSTTTANITALNITGSFTAENKVYDGTTAATVASRSLNGVLAGDLGNVSLTGGSATFANSNVGNGKTVTLSGATLSGSASGNYNLASVSTTTANITLVAITGTFTAANKTYDGTTAATVLTRNLSGMLPGDAGNVSLSGGTATFADSSAGNGKTVTLTGASLSGPSAGNYTLTSVSTTSADISKLAITGSFTAANKVYDGTTAASVVTSSLNGVLSGETVTLSGTASFADKNVGNAKAVTMSGATLVGPTAGNYSLTSVSPTVANITSLNVTGSFTAANKPYDGTTATTVSNRSLSGVLAGDIGNVSLTGGTATFADAAVGNGKTVTLSGATLSGSAAGNYNLASVSTTTANITLINLTGSFTADNKTYDGTTAATVLTRNLSGLLPSDVGNVSLIGGTATFANANVGNGKTVTLSGATLGGSAAGNYTLGSVSTASANITALAITGAFEASDKMYDGTIAATVSTRTLNGVLAGDAMNVNLSGGTASFANKNVGTGKTVTLNGASLSGSAAGNYSLTSVATTTASITPRTLIVSATAQNKVYDGNNLAVATLSDNRAAGDSLSTSFTGATFNDKNVGNAKPVTVTGISVSGGDVANYTLSSTTANTSANITPRTLTITAVTNSKLWDGDNSAAGIPNVTGVQPGDSVTGLAETYDTSAVGTGKTMSVSAYSVNDGNGGNNYSVNTVQNNTGVISPTTALTITAEQTTYGSCGVIIKGKLVKIAGANTGSVIPGCPVTFMMGAKGPFTATTGTDGIATVTVSDLDAANYTASASFAGSVNPEVLSACWAEQSITIAQSLNIGPGPNKGNAIYTGSKMFWTTGPSSSTATLTLSATIKDTGFPCHGDIRTARVTFGVRTGPNTWVPIPNAQNLPVGLVDPTDVTVGTASAVAQWNIGKTDSTATLEIVVVVVGNYYMADPVYDTIVTIAKPGLANGVVASGEFDNEAGVRSGGLLGNAAVGKATMSASVKYNKNFTNPQGDVTVTVNSYNKPDGSMEAPGTAPVTATNPEGRKVHTYLIKSTSVTGFSLQSTSPTIISFTSKVVIQDISGGNSTSIDGGSMQVVISDNNNPDQIRVDVQRKSGGVWYSSAWDGVKTVDKAFTGNLTLN